MQAMYAGSEKRTAASTLNVTNAWMTRYPPYHTFSGVYGSIAVETDCSRIC